ncbi:MAG: TIGR04076 family protein [Proteobacteria bacterium]|nr:TIGR04076 family protein [Pseudomonadota bacterium]
MFDVKLTVKSVKGNCAAGYKEGDHFFVKGGIWIEAGQPQGICMYALPALLPYLTAYSRKTPDDDWINFKQELQCPDNTNAVIFGLERC